MSGDVPVGVAEELLEGVRSPLECGPYEGLIIGSPIEVLDHYLFGNVPDAVPHRLKLLKEQAKGLVILALYLHEIRQLHWLVSEQLEVGDKPIAKIGLVVVEVAVKVASH